MDLRIRTYPRAHILQTFHEQCQLLAANRNAGYRREFEELNETGKEFTCRAGALDANKDKNRYPLILPYDHCRVRLSLLEAQPHSDYINASYVPGGCSEHDFICTQAPLPSTMADFWRMVWEQNVNVIVMVTALQEADKVLCNQYWPPERGTGCYGTLEVTTVSRHHGPDCYITTIHVRKHGFPTERRVMHYHYPHWRDRGVPKNMHSLCTFTEHVRKQLDTDPGLGPTVVHCSAGVGRSGTFVALLWLMQLAVRGIPPDVRPTVQDLRKHRVMMVQNLEQYIFLHHCLLHWLDMNAARPSAKNPVVHFQTVQPHKHTQLKKEWRSHRRHSDHRPESVHSTRHATDNDQPKEPSQQVPQPQHTPSPRHSPSPQLPPSRSMWRSMQNSVTFHPAKFLQRILPVSSQLSSARNTTQHSQPL